MTDYIKREDALLSVKNSVIDQCEMYSLKDKAEGFYKHVQDGIREISSADAAPVRHGEWIHPREYGLNLPEHYCSECRAWEYSDVESKFCPNCGAKMDGESDDE